MRAMSSRIRRLAEAVEEGRSDDVEHLLGSEDGEGGGGGRRPPSGADPNAPAADGLSPIVRAAANGHVHIVKILLRRGAAVDSVHPTSGRSALHLAAATGPVPLARLVISAQAEVEKLDGSGSTPLQLAAGAKSGDMVRELVSAGARLYVAHPRTGDGVLHAAAFSGNPEVVERLLRAGADLDSRNRGKQTPLHVAAREGRFGLVKCLVRAGSDVSAVDVIGRTPLYVAAANGHTQVVMGLAASGADPSILTLGGISALTAAAEESKVSVMEALLKLGLPALGGRRAWADALCACARKGLAGALGKLIPAGGAGGLPGQKFLERTGTSPLHCAAAGGHIWCVMLLLEAGGDETALNSSECTPLEITGARRPEGQENEEQDDRIRRALIKAFLYRPSCWAWPSAIGAGDGGDGGGDGDGCVMGSSNLAAAAHAAYKACAADAPDADIKLSRMRCQSVVAKLRIFRHEHGGEEFDPTAMVHKIIKYGMKTGAQLEPPEEA